jgi:hypothetical protein
MPESGNVSKRLNIAFVMNDLLRTQAKQLYLKMTAEERSAIRKAMVDFALAAVHDSGIQAALFVYEGTE